MTPLDERLQQLRLRLIEQRSAAARRVHVPSCSPSLDECVSLAQSLARALAREFRFKARTQLLSSLYEYVVDYVFTLNRAERLNKVQGVYFFHARSAAATPYYVGSGCDGSRGALTRLLENLVGAGGSQGARARLIEFADIIARRGLNMQSPNVLNALPLNLFEHGELVIRVRKRNAESPCDCVDAVEAVAHGAFDIAILAVDSHHVGFVSRVIERSIVRLFEARTGERCHLNHRTPHVVQGRWGPALGPRPTKEDMRRADETALRHIAKFASGTFRVRRAGSSTARRAIGHRLAHTGHVQSRTGD